MHKSQSLILQENFLFTINFRSENIIKIKQKYFLKTFTLNLISFTHKKKYESTTTLYIYKNSKF